MYFLKNLSVETYVGLMKQTACLVGNSSSGIREGAFIGTPVVNIGSRQNDREHAANVIHAGHDVEEINLAITRHLKNGHYARNSVYGNGDAGKKIAEILSSVPFLIQKRIAY